MLLYLSYALAYYAVGLIVVGVIEFTDKSHHSYNRDPPSTTYAIWSTALWPIYLFFRILCEVIDWRIWRWMTPSGSIMLVTKALVWITRENKGKER